MRSTQLLGASVLQDGYFARERACGVGPSRRFACYLRGSVPLALALHLRLVAVVREPPPPETGPMLAAGAEFEAAKAMSNAVLNVQRSPETRASGESRLKLT